MDLPTPPDAVETEFDPRGTGPLALVPAWLQREALAYTAFERARCLVERLEDADLPRLGWLRDDLGRCGYALSDRLPSSARLALLDAAGGAVRVVPPARGRLETVLVLLLVGYGLTHRVARVDPAATSASAALPHAAAAIEDLCAGVGRGRADALAEEADAVGWFTPAWQAEWLLAEPAAVDLRPASLPLAG